jgi:hypothetical protein
VLGNPRLCLRRSGIGRWRMVPLNGRSRLILIALPGHRCQSVQPASQRVARLNAYAGNIGEYEAVFGISRSPTPPHLRCSLVVGLPH